MADLKEKWKPITRWVPQMQLAQVKVFGETGIWVPLDRMCAHSGIETGYTGDPNIKSRGTNNPANCGQDCVAKRTCAADFRAHGLFQIWCPGFVVNWDKIHDPEYNCYAGAKTLALKYKQCKNWRQASLAFFAGSCVDIGTIDTSTGTSTADYDAAMQRNIQELNSIGIGQGEQTNSKRESPTNGNTNTPTDKPNSVGDSILGAILPGIAAEWFPRILLLIVGTAVLFIGLKAIT